MDQCLKVAIFEEDEMAARMFESALGGDCRPIRVQCFDGSSESWKTVECYLPQVVIIGIGLRNLSAISRLRLLKQASPALKIIVLTCLRDEVTLLKALEAGANGYLVKPVSCVDLLTAFNVVIQDEALLSPSVARQLIEMLVSSKEKAASPNILTTRELEVMAYVSEGLLDKEIASELRLSVQTVKRHLHNVYTKLGVGNRIQAIKRVAPALAGR